MHKKAPRRHQKGADEGLIVLDYVSIFAFFNARIAFNWDSIISLLSSLERHTARDFGENWHILRRKLGKLESFKW